MIYSKVCLNIFILNLDCSFFFIYFKSAKEGAEKWKDPRTNPSLKRAELNEKLSLFPHRSGAVLSSGFYHKENEGKVAFASGKLFFIVTVIIK